MRYLTRDREAGNVIDEFATLDEARKAIEAYEEQDKQDGTYTKDFYEIYDSEIEYQVNDDWVDIDRIRELPDNTILSGVHSATMAEYKCMEKVLKERGYRLCGFHFTKNETESDPVKDIYDKIYNN